MSSNVTKLPIDANDAIARAKAEVNEENMKKGIEALKVKYRALAAAEGVVSNIKREIEDLEQQVKDGTFVK